MTAHAPICAGVVDFANAGNFWQFCSFALRHGNWSMPSSLCKTSWLKCHRTSIFHMPLPFSMCLDKSAEALMDLSASSQRFTKLASEKQSPVDALILVFLYLNKLPSVKAPSGGCASEASWVKCSKKAAGSMKHPSWQDKHQLLHRMMAQDAHSAQF